ncbi:hypothetical protein LSH36_39g15019 [Paralvinella palmiformis]|uniref:receptor protein-tyrosine kinase n=1 Tax=Paralvinella palmiformis TaxID=53620 RepID=A0AAD9K9D2_9ANNE|nr:hypothetical protein LSH36_39g15019 [Paralvinella palmiformis]
MKRTAPFPSFWIVLMIVLASLIGKHLVRTESLLDALNKQFGSEESDQSRYDIVVRRILSESRLDKIEFSFQFDAGVSPFLEQVEIAPPDGESSAPRDREIEIRNQKTSEIYLLLRCWTSYHIVRSSSDVILDVGRRGVVKLYSGDANQSVPPPELDNFPSADDLPHFTKPEQMEPSLLIRPVGSSIRLSCDALGFPLPAIDWYKDGQKIDTAVLDDHMESGKWRFGSSNNGGNSEDGSKADSDMWSLPLVSLQEEDSGEYKCVVSNGHGEISHTYTLTVIEESKAKPILVPPNPRNMTVRYGEMASFMCEVHSIDQPHIQWLKRLDGTSTSQSDSTIRVNGQEFVVLQTGEVLSRQDGSFLNKLTINHATEEDSGMYICLGANTKGYTIRSAYLTVLPESVYSSGMDAIPQETSSFWDNRALPIIIGIPAGIILVIITIAVCIIKRKQGRAVARPPNQPTVRVQHYPPQSHVYGQTPSEKVFDHQYAALHPQYPVDATSQDRIIKTYSDKHSDSSYPSPPQTSGTPPVPSLAPTPTSEYHENKLTKKSTTQGSGK